MGNDDKKSRRGCEARGQTLEHTGADGKKQSYYPPPQIWLDLQDLRLAAIEGPQRKGEVPSLAAQVRGEAGLEDYGISIIGEPKNQARTLKVSFKTVDHLARAKEHPGSFGSPWESRSALLI